LNTRAFRLYLGEVFAGMRWSAVLVLTALIAFSVQPAHGYAGIGELLEKGYTIKYQVSYYSYEGGSTSDLKNLTLVDYYSISVQDRYISTYEFIVLNIEYSGYYGFYEKSYVVKLSEVFMYVPVISSYQGVDISSSKELTLSIPIPVKDWNTPADPSQILSIKTISVKPIRITEYNLEFTNITIPVESVMLEGVEGQWRYNVYIDKNTGLLLRLDAFSSNKLLFTIELIYATPYSNLVMSPKPSIDTNSPVVSRVVAAVVVAITAISVLLLIYARAG